MSRSTRCATCLTYGVDNLVKLGVSIAFLCTPVFLKTYQGQELRDLSLELESLSRHDGGI